MGDQMTLDIKYQMGAKMAKATAAEKKIAFEDMRRTEKDDAISDSTRALVEAYAKLCGRGHLAVMSEDQFVSEAVRLSGGACRLRDCRAVYRFDRARYLMGYEK